MIAALYVDARGPYVGMPGVDVWDEARDARLYPGPWSVVAHPPCERWGGLSQFSTHDNAHLAVIAVAQVRAYGGVLEHPAGSKLWKHCGLPRPGEFPDRFGGLTLEVDHVCWEWPGHKQARKRTWLYCVRCDLEGLVIPALA